MASPTPSSSMLDQRCKDCDGNCKVEMEVVYALGVATGLFLLLTIVCGVLVIAMLWRTRQRTGVTRKAGQECPYWEERPATPVPSLEETLSSQTKLNTLGLETTESFRQVTTKGGTTPAVTRGSREATQGRGKVTPKRSAPPPPRGKGRSRFLGGIRKASLMERSSDETEYATPHLYVLQPSAIAQGPHPHDYRHLDQANVQPERQYTHLVRGGSLPPIQICSTTFESS